MSLKAMTVPVMAALKIIGNTDRGRASERQLKAERHSALGSEARVPIIRGQISMVEHGYSNKRARRRGRYLSSLRARLRPLK